MPVEDQSALKTALSHRDSGRESLLRTPESDWLDIKEPPGWNLDTPKGKWDLLSDVSSFASADGGIILVGARTTQHAESRIETLAELRPVPLSGLPDPDRLRKLIREHIHPPMTPPPEIILWDMGTEQYVLTVAIGKQQASDLPFIVSTGVDEDGTPRGNMFGYFRREGDSSPRIPHTYVHDLMRDGFRFRHDFDSLNSGNPNGLLSLLENIAGGSTARPRGVVEAPEPLTPEDASIEAERLISAIEVSDQAHLVVQSWQHQGFEVRDFFSRDGFHDQFRRPPQLRETGFNLDFPVAVETPDGQTLQRAVTNRVALSAKANGLLTLVVGRQHLGWAMDQLGGADLINPIPLTEYIVEFCRLTADLMNSRRETADRASSYSLAMHGLRPGEPSALLEGMPRHVWTTDARHVAGGRTEFSIGPVAIDDPETAAFELMRRCYAEFALGPEAIPFADVKERRIPFATLREYGRG